MDTILPNIKALILDMDGVLWRDKHLLVDIPKTLQTYERLGLKFVMCTNNSTRSIPHFINTFKKLGIELDASQIVNSAVATALYLKQIHPEGGNIFLVGEEGLFETMEEYGFHHSTQNLLAVVAGLHRGLTWDILAQATLLIRAGVPFLGTNPDPSFPIPEGEVPGAGAILAALEAASDVKPKIIGKPSPMLYEIAMDRLGVRPENTLAVGDRLSTDIAGGLAAGCKTALVLSGVTTLEQGQDSATPPDLIFQDLNALTERLTHLSSQTLSHSPISKRQ